MKTYTQQFKSYASRIQASLYKITRTANTAADALANDAHSQAHDVHQLCYLDCSFGAHSAQCLLFQGPLSTAVCIRSLYYVIISFLLLK
jgi:hypothetical protein